MNKLGQFEFEFDIATGFSIIAGIIAGFISIIIVKRMEGGLILKLSSFIISALVGFFIFKKIGTE
jgi:hypothetical protein